MYHSTRTEDEITLIEKKYGYFNEKFDISTRNGSSLKLVDKFTYLWSNVSSTETDIITLLAKVWTAIHRLLAIWKGKGMNSKVMDSYPLAISHMEDLTDKIKRSFF